jgi:hypothetical protein
MKQAWPSQAQGLSGPQVHVGLTVTLRQVETQLWGHPTGDAQ